MLVRRELSRDLVEFVEPRRGVQALLWLLLCSPLIVVAVEHVVELLGRPVTLRQLAVWHAWLWLDLGPVFWVFVCRSFLGAGPFAHQLSRAFSTFLAAIPGMRRRTIRLDLARGLVTVPGPDGPADHALKTIERVYLKPLDPDKGDQSEYEVGLVGAAGRVPLARFALYLPARQAAEAMARAAGRALEDLLVGKTRSVEDLDRGLAREPPATHPGEPPTDQLKAELGTLRNRLGLLLQYRVQWRMVPPALMVGVCLLGMAAVIEFAKRSDLSWTAPFQAPSGWRLLLGVPVGFFGFWQILLMLFNTAFPVALAVNPRRVRYAYTRFGLFFTLQSADTSAIEDVLVRKGSGGWDTLVITDDEAVMFAIRMNQTRAESEWIAAWIRWAVGQARPAG